MTMKILERFSQEKIQEFLDDLQKVCDKHEVSLVWAVNCIRIVSNNKMEIISPEMRIQLARVKTILKNGSLHFELTSK